LTANNSARGDIYETKVSKTENPTDDAGNGSQAFTLSQTITVAKGSFVKIAFVGDLSTGATEGDIHTIKISAVTANGATTGEDITVAPSGDGQGMTVATGGALTLSRDDASSPIANIVIGGKEATLGVFRLDADTVEDLDLDSIKIYVTGSDYIDSLSFWHEGTKIAEGTPIVVTGTDGYVYVAIAEGTVTVPADGHEEITVKGTLNPVGVTGGLANSGAISVSFRATTYMIEYTGLASGSALDTDEVVASYQMEAYESRPYFSKNADSPSGNLEATSGQRVAIFDVTAEDTENITFEQSSGGLVVNIAATIDATDGTATAFVLKDGDGNVLDGTATAADGATSVTFDFEDKAFTVPKGETKQLVIEANLSDWNTDGDTIRLWLDDASDSNVTWSIDNGTNYQEGKIIFRGDIYAGSLVNPS